MTQTFCQRLHAPKTRRGTQCTYTVHTTRSLSTQCTHNVVHTRKVHHAIQTRMSLVDRDRDRGISVVGRDREGGDDVWGGIERVVITRALAANQS